MAQPAHQFTQREQVRRQKHVTSDSRAIALPRRRITKGEKVLWTAAVIAIFVFAIVIISRQAQIYTASVSATHMQNTIDTVQKNNDELNEQVQKLKQPDRILEFAKKHGLNLNINNVKMVNK
ncbi:cell division protein FtsL [Pullulanibacillus camelliae]|uniref:Cell division protein FtsL n=1 Tax=Pullulanibacillus camelliae TaxID=1707096 RepID=A0A8J2VZZ1_9BACL|nr:cell division protein FtsL [Pullulanibacillus camelliae]GGE41296.1 cell division protein FtsL [Pullulanibacillus camelliae]